MISKFLLLTIVFYFQFSSSAAKICYQCDDKNPSSKFKFWGAKITKCSGVPFEKYWAKISKASDAAVLTCYTRFDETGAVIKRDAYEPGEVFDKNFKCRDRFDVCCNSSFCNKHMKVPIPCSPPSKITPKQEVKTCYQCKDVDIDNCKPKKLEETEIRTLGVFGAKNLYCYTVDCSAMNYDIMLLVEQTNS